MGVQVAGCSADTLERQRAFADKLGGLRYPLIADPSREIIHAYGVAHESLPIAARATVLIGDDGVVRRAYPQVHARGHAEELVIDLRNTWE